MVTEINGSVDTCTRYGYRTKHQWDVMEVHVVCEVKEHV